MYQVVGLEIKPAEVIAKKFKELYGECTKLLVYSEMPSLPYLQGDSHF